MPELDSLRGIAILLVMLFHGFAGAYLRLHFSGFPGKFVWATQYGSTGVNLFFVLSGFLITGILLDTKHQAHYYRDFYARRALRILPAYYLLLVLLVFLGAGTAAFYVLSFFYLSNVTDLFGVVCAYGPLWSLAVEEHYYFVWPALVRNLTRRNLAICAGTLWLTIPLLRWACFGHVPAEKLRIYTWFCADNLAAGSLLAVLLRTSVTRRFVALVSGASILLGLVLAGTGGWYGVANIEHLAGAIFSDTVLSLVFSGMLALFLLAGSSRRPWLVQSRVLQFFGYISYSLYLFQLLIAGLYDRIAFRFLLNLQPSSQRFDLAVFRFAMTSALAIGLAYLSRHYFEEFFLRLKSRFSTGSKLVPVAGKQTLAAQSRA